MWSACKTMHVRYATGDRNAKSCIELRVSHCTVDATSGDQSTAGPTAARLLSSAPPLRISILGFSVTIVHTSYCDRLTRPICALCRPITTPDRGATFSLKPSRFLYWEILLTRRCGSMQARAKRKDHWQAELPKSVLCRSCTGQNPIKRSCHFAGTINSAFRRLTH
jgi:hypothetical protein